MGQVCQSKFENYRTGQATLPQFEATLKQQPKETLTVSCEGLQIQEIEFGFGLHEAPLGRKAWMNPYQFVTLPKAFCEWK